MSDAVSDIDQGAVRLANVIARLKPLTLLDRRFNGYVAALHAAGLGECEAELRLASSACSRQKNATVALHVNAALAALVGDKQEPEA